MLHPTCSFDTVLTHVSALRLMPLQFIFHETTFHLLRVIIMSSSELNPTPTEEICLNFNELRSDMVLHMELKAALATCEFELQSLRHQYEALNPGKVCT